MSRCCLASRWGIIQSYDDFNFNSDLGFCLELSSLEQGGFFVRICGDTVNGFVFSSFQQQMVKICWLRSKFTFQVLGLQHYCCIGREVN